MNMRKPIGMLAAAIAVGGLVLTAQPAEATTKCTSTVAKSALKFVSAKAKALQKCEDAVLKGTAGFTSTPGTRCADSGGKTSAAIAKAETGLKSAIEKACCGKDKICGNIDDAPGVFQYGACPDVDGPNAPAANCGGLIQDASDAADCIACILEENVDEAIDAIYGAMNVAATGDAEKCQQAIGKSTMAFFTTRAKSLAKCEDGLFKGKITGPCPDAAKAVPAIDKAEAKKLAAIAKVCGGADGVVSTRVCSNAGDRLGLACPTEGLDDSCDVCDAGAKAGDVCSNDNDCTVCVGGTNAGSLCFGNASICPGGTCPLSTCGDGAGQGACTAPVNDDQLISDLVSTTKNCEGGTNDGAICTVNSECPAGICLGASCPSVLAGAGPVGQIGKFDDLQDVIDCVDRTASERTDCTDSAGASTVTNLTTKCTEDKSSCTATGGTTSFAVKFQADAGVSVAGIAVAVGYRNASFPGTGDLIIPTPGRITTPQVGVSTNGNDLEDGLLLSIAGVGALSGDTLFNVTFDNCTPAPTLSDLSCIVVQASDDLQAEIASGVRCFIQ